MGIDAVTFGGSAMQAAPRMVADLRPTADAAALARDPRAAAVSATPPAAAQPATQPATLSQAAEVSRSLIGQRVGAVTELQRVLKPWGVAMLPSDPPPQPDKGGKAATDGPAETPVAARDAAQDAARTEASARAGDAPDRDEHRGKAGTGQSNDPELQRRDGGDNAGQDTD